MSRIGKQPIAIPQGVNVEIKKDVVKVKGPKGENSYSIPQRIKVSMADNKISVERVSDMKEDRALHGLARSLMSNMVNGVFKGYERVLEIIGIGYRAQVKGNRILFTLGYSHPVEFELPAGVAAKADEKQTTITLSGIDKQLLGQVAANIKELRTPDAYKGKGIRYAGERIKLKAGKTGKK
ncbi:MAG: 50S ribosomal protein L6 [Nitrospirae bacterium GWC2_46_6]|nr:MAG: 50S ribosomal protein L6 [Nitrospirae bacterium GWC2_46_6]OGW20664.1 MAG: 50S ribosomal protein L6 [Nitrospirae bacterium GWA2_46_11]OGW24659.1 MAG: 50S ribosomal protein L6 [Nitrospirae bacterium GWB2_47_37]HAK88092.1 50S ribosomal protein L6 [Nitrospiraceae bacterium]HCZ12250.1 50S ribosomal protein L6 [Nitrospiraceae bacterium]